MPSIFWYSGFAVIGVIIAAFSIYKKRHVIKISNFIVFYLFAACITWIGEFVALGLFNGYAYKPGVFKDPWEENLLGHLLLNTTIWPGAATLMVAYSLKYGGISLITLAFILLEYLFTKLGIYEQHWWRYYMSVIIVVLFLVIAKAWFEKINQKHYGSSRAITFYFVGFLIIHFPMPLLLLLGKQRYSLSLIYNLVGNLYRSSIMFIFVYHLVEVVIFVFFICILDNWFWKLVPFVIAFIGQSLFVNMNILIFENSWNLAYTIFIYSVGLLSFILIERYTLKPSQ